MRFAEFYVKPPMVSAASVFPADDIRGFTRLI